MKSSRSMRCGRSADRAFEPSLRSLRRPLLPKTNMDSLTGELVEGVDEVAAMAHGDDVAILPLSDRKAERKRACEVVAMAVTERRRAQDFAPAIPHDDLSVAVDIGVSVRSVT